MESNICQALDGGTLAMRIGLHAGATVGGVVGQKMVRYHLFGPPLEGVTRMEQAGPGRHCSLHHPTNVEPCLLELHSMT